VLYNGSGGPVYSTIPLNGIIPNLQGGYGVLSFAAVGLQNGSPDGIALVGPGSVVVQFLSYEGTFTAVGGPANGLTSTDISVSEPSDSPVGYSLQLTGSGSASGATYGDFTWVAPAPHTFGAVNTGQSFAVIVNQPVTVSCGGTLSTLVGTPVTRDVTATDADGTVIDITVSDVTPPLAAGSIAVTALTPAAGVGGMATATVTVDAAVPGGSYVVTVTATNNDSPTPQTASCLLNVNVIPILPIGAVQGSVSDSADGLLHRSIYAPASGNGSGQTVAVRGVIYQKTLARTSAGAASNGFFIQNTAATADGDPNSSDGIFVFMGAFTSLIGGYTPQVGDEIVLQGRVSEFFNMTQLSSGRALAVLRSGVDLGAEVPAYDANPPDVLADANRYWERREGMRGQVPAGAIAVDGRDVFASTADAEVWLARGDHPIALRADPYARRAFRDPHPLDNDPAQFDDGNGYRILLGSLGVKAAAGDNTVLLAPVRTYDTVNNALTGGLYFSFSKYQILPEQQPDLTQGVDPALNAPPQPLDRDQEYSVATFNVENLYDYRDDPFDGCDFTGNTGCPGVNPPFDYVPPSDLAYQTRLGEIAQQIAGDLQAPDILLIQEAEDQDICGVSGGVLACGASDDVDGRPDTLQELALAIATLGGPWYEAAYDRDGADDRGIVSGFLYRTDRVELLPAPMDDPVLGSVPQVIYRGDPLAFNTDVQNPKALNADLPADVDTSTGVDGSNVFTRPPQIGLFRVWQFTTGSGPYLDVYAVSNHFSSTPNARVGQRTEQALYNSAIVAALQAADPGAYVFVGGDLNVYPRPDDPFVPGEPRYPSDQLGSLYNQGLLNLYDVVLNEIPVSAYGYVFQGQTQTLDQVFITPSLEPDHVQSRFAHINSDFPADYDGDGPRGTSDHDPLVGRFCVDMTPPVLNIALSPDMLWPPNHQYETVTATVTADDADPNPTIELVSVTSNEPDNGLGDGDQEMDIVVVDPYTFQLRAERSGTGGGRTYTITYRATDACGNVAESSALVIVPKSQKIK
jgi:hypothetical protein